MVEQQSEKAGAGYTVGALVGESAELDELAEFLADFVARGELDGALDGDDVPEPWRRRMAWWWEENPFCQKGSQLGFLLRTGAGELVGFHGLIPYDYEVAGKRVPGLISSIFFVLSDHRAGSMGLFFKVQRLAKDFHLVDGGPTSEVAEILGRFGYQRGGERKFFFYRTRAILRKRRLKAGLHLVTDPAEIGEVPPVGDDRIRRVVTPESLSWLGRIGSKRRRFFGVCDDGGRLVAYALGIEKKLPGGMLGYQIVDYCSFDEKSCEVFELLEHVASHRKAIGLAKGVVALIWGLENGATPPPRKYGLRRHSKVYYVGPKGMEETEKVVLPIEGDYLFF